MKTKQDKYVKYDRRHYHFPRTSREAFGHQLKSSDFEVEVPQVAHTGDRAVVVFCLVVAVCIMFGWIG